MNKITKFILSLIAGAGMFFVTVIIGKGLGSLLYKLGVFFKELFGFNFLYYAVAIIIIIVFAILFYKTKWSGEKEKK